MLINIRKPCQQQLSFMLTAKTTCYWLKANVVTSVWNWRRLLKKVEKQNFQMLCWKDKSQGWSKISERGDAFSSFHHQRSSLLHLSAQATFMSVMNEDLTGNSTTGTVNVTATSTARRTHRMRTSFEPTRLYVCSSSDSTPPFHKETHRVSHTVGSELIHIRWKIRSWDPDTSGSFTKKITTTDQGDLWPLGSGRRLTVKSEVTKDGRQQVHDEHGQDGDVSDALHSFLGGTGGLRIKKKKEN